MKDIHNNSLFTNITDEEAASIRGGVPAAVLAGGVAFAKWIGTPGNAVFVNADGRRGTVDDFYMGNMGTDSDPNGWRWGIRSAGNWIFGGYGTKGNFIAGQIIKLVKQFKK